MADNAQSVPMKKDFKVAIVGGGMCGLACAVALHKAGVEVDVFESAVSPVSFLSMLSHH